MEKTELTDEAMVDIRTEYTFDGDYPRAVAIDKALCQVTVAIDVWRNDLYAKSQGRMPLDAGPDFTNVTTLFEAVLHLNGYEIVSYEESEKVADKVDELVAHTQRIKNQRDEANNDHLRTLDNVDNAVATIAELRSEITRLEDEVHRLSKPQPRTRLTKRTTKPKEKS